MLIRNQRREIIRSQRVPARFKQDNDLPLAAVLEAIDYCLHNQELLAEEQARETAGSRRLDAINGLTLRAIRGRWHESLSG